MMWLARMKKEVEMLEKSPPPGASCWPVGDNGDQLEAAILGMEDTP